MTTFETLAAQLAGLDSVNGITPVEILLLPEALRPVMRKMLRRAVSLPEFAGDLLLSEAQAQQIAAVLVQKGFLKPQSEGNGPSVAYRVHFARRHAHDIPPEL